MLKTYDDATCETQVAPRRRSEAGQVLSALARNMDHDNGLRSIFYSIAVMADYELWSINLSRLPALDAWDALPEIIKAVVR